MLPAIVQQKYAQAKSAFDRKEFAAAAELFSQVLVTLTDPDIAAEAMHSPLADLRTLAVGFEELSAKAAAPPPPPAPPVPVVATPPLQPPPPPRVYSGDDRTVIPPNTVNQVLPLFPGQVMVPRVGKIEVVIDESGDVESAVMLESVTMVYDRLALAAAKGWRYKPATLNGVPVKYRKVVQISVKVTT
jgi:TonB family protein